MSGKWTAVNRVYHKMRGIWLTHKGIQSRLLEGKEGHRPPSEGIIRIFRRVQWQEID